MKTSKRVLSVLLSVLMLAGCFALTASAVTQISNITLNCLKPEAGGAFTTRSDILNYTYGIGFDQITIYEVQGNISKKATAPFESGKTYEIDFTLSTRTNDYNFATNLSASVNGETCRAVYLSKTKANVVWNVTVTDYTVGDTFQFGRYPQTQASETTSLKNAADAATWKSYGYYIGTGNNDGNMYSSNFMQYADFYSGIYKYRAVRFTKYRPASTTLTSSMNNSYQDSNGYSLNTTYYFRYDPLTWRVLDPAAGLVLCEDVVDSQAYQNVVWENAGKLYAGKNSTTYANNYGASSIRTWLNQDFYNTAFNDAQKENIISDSRGKVFLLSAQEATSASFGLSTQESRATTYTYYAKCQGLDNRTGWWLRTPRTIDPDDPSHYVVTAAFNGVVDYNQVYSCNYYLADTTCIGVRPACRMNKLNRDTSVANEYIISASAAPTAGGTVNGGGKFTEGESVTLTATPSSGYRFMGWYEGDTCVSKEKNYTFQATKNVSLTAEFEEDTYVVYIVSQSTGSGTGGGRYPVGTTVTVTAEPNSGYRCIGWAKRWYDGSAFRSQQLTTESSYTFTVTEDIELTPLFGLIGDCIVTVEAQTGGSVSGGGTYASGSSVTVKAVPNSGYRFGGWYEAGINVSDSDSYTFTVSRNITLTAKFVQNSTPDNPAQPDNPGGGQSQGKVCKYCGEVHTGFLGFFVGLFHSILALFGLRK